MLAGLFVGRPARRGRAVMPGSEDAGQSLNLQRCRDGSRSWSQAFRQPTPLQVSPPLWRGRPGHRTKAIA